MPAACVSSAHSETFHWRKCCILWSQACIGRQGSMLTSPGAGSWPLPFPTASPVSPEVQSIFWCLAKAENPAPENPSWAVSWGFLGVEIWSGWFCSEEVSVYHWEVFPGSKGAWKPFHYIQEPFGLVGEAEVKTQASLQKVSPLFAPLYILFLGW